MLLTIRLIIIVSLVFSFSTSCGNKKNTIETAEEDEKQREENTDELKMKELGFVKATVKDFSKNEGCGFLIILQESEQILQPLKALDIAFQKDGLPVWIKYRPIRPIAPICKKGTPIDVEEIKSL